MVDNLVNKTVYLYVNKNGTTMSTATVRIDKRTHQLLQEIKNFSGESMQTIISKALENYKEVQFWEEVNEAYSKLRANKKDWAEEKKERKMWERANLDGIQKD